MAHARRDLAKEGWWREVIARHVASGLSVRAFCRQESLAESAFHSWRRTIAARDGQLAPRRRPIPARHGEVAVRDGQVAASMAPRHEPTFVPAVVTPAGRRASALPGDGAHVGHGARERDGAITIELAGGRVLRLPEAMDAARLAEIVQALETSAGEARGAR